MRSIKKKAQRMMKNVGSKEVRVVDQTKTLLIESNTPDTKAVYFLRESTGAIVGPAPVDFATRVDHGSSVQYWLFVIYDGLPSAVNTTQLRSQQEFETQVKLKPVTLIREPR